MVTACSTKLKYIHVVTRIIQLNELLLRMIIPQLLFCRQNILVLLKLNVIEVML